MKFKIAILACVLLFFQYTIVIAQQKSEIDVDDDAILDFHIALSLENGIRVGSRYYFLNNYSVELTYGVNLEVFGGGDGGSILGIGVNAFPFEKQSFLVGILGFYSFRNDYDTYYVISPSIGFLTPREKGFIFLARAGLNIIRTSYQSNNNTKVRPQFEIGVGFSF